MLTITILGSGPSRLIPRAGCICDLCRDARRGTKSARSRSSILIQDKNKVVLIDTSPDFLSQAAREKIKKINAVFFTHQHSDATGGFADFIGWCRARGESPMIFATAAVTKYLKNRFPSVVKIHPSPSHSLLARNASVKEGVQRLPLFKRGIKGDFVNPILIRLAPFSRIKIGGLTIESFPVCHGMGRPISTVGYRINGKTIFISDFDGFPPQSARYLVGSKVMILDAAMWFDRKIKGHNTPKEAIAIAKKFNPRILYLTQTGHTWPPHKRAQKIISDYAKKQKINFSVVIAYDELSIKV